MLYLRPEDHARLYIEDYLREAAARALGRRAQAAYPSGGLRAGFARRLARAAQHLHPEAAGAELARPLANRGP